MWRSSGRLVSWHIARKLRHLPSSLPSPRLPLPPSYLLANCCCTTTPTYAHRQCRVSVMRNKESVVIIRVAAAPLWYWICTRFFVVCNWSFCKACWKEIAKSPSISSSSNQLMPIPIYCSKQHLSCYLEDKTGRLSELYSALFITIAHSFERFLQVNRGMVD